MTYEDFYALPVVMSFFPLVFADGARWETFRGYCADCDGELREDRFRGHVTQPFWTYRGNASTYVVEAWGLCSKCDVLTPFHWQLLPDMTMRGRTKDGQMGTWLPRRLWWSPVRKFLRRVLRLV